MSTKEFVIRENTEQYMRDLKEWLAETKDAPPEEMSRFFEARIDGYEEHMSPWRAAYVRTARLIPPDTKTLLDIGCGTGLELDEIFPLLPCIRVTGIDLSEAMLRQLRAKHSGRDIDLICADYFSAEIPEEKFDAAVSFQTLHHFRPQKKLELFKKLHRTLKPGGRYVETDYLACCDEEEELLFAACERKRRAANVPEDVFIHFDTPLTLEHELELLLSAGFSKVEPVDCINGASMVVAEK